MFTEIQQITMQVSSSIGLPPTTAVFIRVLVFLGYIIFSTTNNAPNINVNITILSTPAHYVLHLDRVHPVRPSGPRTWPLWRTGTSSKLQIRNQTDQHCYIYRTQPRRNCTRHRRQSTPGLIENSTSRVQRSRFRTTRWTGPRLVAIVTRSCTLGHNSQAQQAIDYQLGFVPWFRVPLYTLIRADISREVRES